MKLNEYASRRKTKGSYRLPRSVQQSIPVEQIYADGIWRSGEVYSQMWSISDINYAMLSDARKKEIQTLYGAVYAGIPADCWCKFCIVSQRMDEKAFRREILLQRQDDGNDLYRDEYNRLLENRVQEIGNVRQQKFLIVSTNKRSVREARERLRHVQGHLISALSALGCTVREAGNNDRLRVLHGFFRVGEEETFRFDLGEYTRLGQDFRDAVCPDSITFLRDHIEIDDRYAKVMLLMTYPQRLDDTLIANLLRQAPYLVVSLDVVPVETEDAYREIEDGRMKVDADRVRFNRKLVDVSVDSKTFFNPLDFTYDPVTKIPPHTAKAEFMLSLCEQIMGKENIIPGDKSLIDRSLKNIYKPLVRAKYQTECPTLTDLWQDLQNQRQERARQIALALEIFAAGSLNMFAQHTNVDMSNRLICFNIQSLGDQLKPVAMLSMLEYINTRVMENNRSDPEAATWAYFDEIYLLLRNELSAHFLFVSWKRFRKYNAYATGITQNVQDCLANDTAYAMLANSEFVVMLRQTKDIDSVVELYGLSEPQRNYLLLAQPGQGILKMGNALIPFENEYPKGTKTYRLLTTKPGETE